jgi:hypothetical protein
MYSRMSALSSATSTRSLPAGPLADVGSPAEIHRSANPDVRRFLAGELREI